MPRPHPNPCAQQVAPKGFPSEGDGGRRDPLLPRLPSRELGTASGAGRSGDSRASGGGAEWWQASSGESSPTEPGVGVRNSPPRLPALPNRTRRTEPDRAGLKSLLLPPLLLAGAPQTPACLRPGSRESPSEWQHQRGVTEHCQLPQCPECPFLPDLQGQTSFFQNSLMEILPHEIPTLGPLRRDHVQFKKASKANNRPHGIQAPKLKAALTHSSSAESSGRRRRRCSFRVRFADETLRDTALRYWERSCALQQGTVENRPATRSAASERVFDSVGRWLESLPEEAATAGSPHSWDCPGLPLPELQGHTSEGTVNSSLPFIPRATTQRQQRGLKTFLGSHSLLEQGSFLPHLVLHKVWTRSRPKGYQLFLPSLTQPRAQR